MPSKHWRLPSFGVCKTQGITACTEQWKHKLCFYYLVVHWLKTAPYLISVRQCYLLSKTAFSCHHKRGIGSSHNMQDKISVRSRRKHQLFTRHKLFLIYTQYLIPGSQEYELCFKNNMLTSHLPSKDRRAQVQCKIEQICQVYFKEHGDRRLIKQAKATG